MDLTEGFAPTPQAVASKSHIKKVSYQHLPVIDLILGQPHITVKELARQTGFEYNWLCRVVRSDAFVARVAQRRNELLGEKLSTDLGQRLKAMLVQSTDVLMKKLSAEESADLALKALGLATRGLAVLSPTAPAKKG
jgi:hypothetical protein